MANEKISSDRMQLSGHANITAVEYPDFGLGQIKQEKLERILDLVATGNYSERQASLDVYGTPWLIFNAKRESEIFAQQSARAREIGCDAIADHCLVIADDSSRDAIVSNDGSERANTEFVNRSRLRVDTRLRLLGKWSQRYGDKIQFETDKDDPLIGALNNLSVSVVADIVSKLKGADNQDDG